MPENFRFSLYNIIFHEIFKDLPIFLENFMKYKYEIFNRRYQNPFFKR